MLMEWILLLKEARDSPFISYQLHFPSMKEDSSTSTFPSPSSPSSTSIMGETKSSESKESAGTNAVISSVETQITTTNERQTSPSAIDSTSTSPRLQKKPNKSHTVSFF